MDLPAKLPAPIRELTASNALLGKRAARDAATNAVEFETGNDARGRYGVGVATIRPVH